MNELQKEAAVARIAMARRFREIARRQDQFRTDILPVVKENLELEFQRDRLRLEVEMKEAEPALSQNQVQRKAYKEAKKTKRVYDNLFSKAQKAQQYDPFHWTSPQEEGRLDEWYDALTLECCPEIIAPRNAQAIRIWQEVDTAYMKNDGEGARQAAEKLEVEAEEVPDTYLHSILEQYRKNAGSPLPLWNSDAMDVMEKEGGMEAYRQQLDQERAAFLEEIAQLEAKKEALFK